MFLIDKITVSSLIKLKIFLVFVENSFFQEIQSFGNSKCLSCASFRKKNSRYTFGSWFTTLKGLDLSSHVFYFIRNQVSALVLKFLKLRAFSVPKICLFPGARIL